MAPSVGFAQIPAGGKNLFVIRDHTNGGFTTPALLAAVRNNSSVISYDGTILNCTNTNDILGSVTTTQVYQYQVWRDMGKSLHVKKEGMTEAIFTYAQLVDDNNAGYEGVPSVPNLWICTWQASGSGCPTPVGMVYVVRSG